jgi:hypothetical protein
MFKKTKFKVGDMVVLLSDMTRAMEVKKVWLDESYHLWPYSICEEKVLLSDNRVYDIDKIAPDIKSVRFLANEVRDLKIEVEKLKSIPSIKKELKKIEKNNDSSWASVYSDWVKKTLGGSWD